MDKRTKAEVINIVTTAIEDTIRQTMEGYNEQYVTADVLMEQYQMFTPEWLKKFGKYLPQTRAIVIDEDGVEHQTRRVGYAKNKIARMIQDGSIERLVMTAR